MDTPIDIERQKYLEWKEAQMMALQDMCEKCSEHDENCPYYDSEEEWWDYKSCDEDRGGWE